MSTRLPRYLLVHKSFRSSFDQADGKTRELVIKQLEILVSAETPSGRMHVDANDGPLQGKLYKSHVRRQGERIYSLRWSIRGASHEFILPILLTDCGREDIDYNNLDLRVAYEILSDFKSQEHTAFELWDVTGEELQSFALPRWPFREVLTPTRTCPPPRVSSFTVVFTGGGVK